MPKFTQVAADLVVAETCDEKLKVHSLKRAYEKYPHEWAIISALASAMRNLAFRSVLKMASLPPARIA